MAHLVTVEGQALGVADGLSIVPSQWQAGDIIVQRHKFDVALKGQTLWLRAGAYELDSGIRWTLSLSGMFR